MTTWPRHLLSKTARLHLLHLALVGLALVLTAGMTAPVVAQQQEGSPPPLAGEDEVDLPCFDGRLRIRDLALADPYMPEGLAQVYEKGKAWQSDALLYSLRLGCPLLEAGFQLEGTFFSRTAQAFYVTGTSEIQASDAAPGTVPTFDTTNGVKVSFVYRSLVRAGFDEDAVLGPASGVTIQPNTDSMPFGPRSAPKGDVYYHVSILQRGEVSDVWVASQDGTVYRYTSD